MASSLPPLAAYLRVASLAIAIYDVAATLPGELSLYRRQPSIRRMSKACILFIGVRYVTIAALVTSSVGFFGTHFSHDFCHRFHVVAPALKLAATLISQLIVSTRAYAVSRGNRLVLYVLILSFILTLPPEIMGNLIGRVPLQDAAKNCTSGNNKKAMFAWLHYLAAMIFDAIALAITLWYLMPTTSLFRRKSLPRQPGTFVNEGTTGVHSLSRLLLREGILYFVALTGVNVLNLVFFRLENKNLQSGAATLGQAVTMIFSQKFILNLTEHVHGSTSFSRNLSDTKGLSQGRRPTGISVNGATPRGDTFELSGIQVTTEVVQMSSGKGGEFDMRHETDTVADTPTFHEKSQMYWEP